MSNKEMSALNRVHTYVSFAICKLQDLAIIIHSITQEYWDILWAVPLIYLPNEVSDS